MSIWYDAVASQRRRLERLLPRAAALFAAACIDHAFASLCASFASSSSLQPNELAVARESLDILWNAVKASLPEQIIRQAITNVSLLEPGEESPQQAEEGWSYIISGICSALECLIRNDVGQHAMYAAENAYLAIEQRAASAYMREKKTYLDRSRDADLEQENPRLRAEVDFQLDILGRCETGAPVEPSIRER
jgi:hypothetical protein